VRAGSTAFASSPTANAENTRENGGVGSAWLITARHAIARARTESRLSPIAARIQRQLTSANASPTRFQSGPCHQSITTATARNATTISPRVHGLCGTYLKRGLRRDP
jgi:hypothetical protein